MEVANAVKTPQRKPKPRRPRTSKERIERHRARTAALLEQARQMQYLPDCAILSGPLVRLLCGNISDSTMTRWVKTGRFPPPRNGTWTAGQVRKALEV